MGLRIGARRRKDKQTDDKKSRKSSSSKSTDKLNTLPPTSLGGTRKAADYKRSTASPIPSSIDTTNSNNFYGSQSAGNRGVLFRDNRFPDGTTIPRIQTLQSLISPAGRGREGCVSPTGSVHSLASNQPALLNYASYPPSYVPQNSMKPTDITDGKRERVHSDSTNHSVYAESLPRPDYPLSNDGTGNSNRDSGLDTESRSSSGGKLPFAGTADRCPRWKDSKRQGYYEQPKDFKSRHFSRERPNSVYNFSESPQILLPRNHQYNNDASDFENSVIATPSRCRRQISINDVTNSPSEVPRQWVNQKDLKEKAHPFYPPKEQYHRYSYSCGQNVFQNSHNTGSLQRFQLEDGLTPEKCTYDIPSGRSRRRFRREDECLEYTVRSASLGLPRNQPIRRGYFEEKTEVDRYGRLSPVRRPVSRTLDERETCSCANEEVNEDISELETKAGVDYSEDEMSDCEDTPYNSNYLPAYGSRSQMQPSFYRQSSAPSIANHEVGISRL